MDGFHLLVCFYSSSIPSCITGVIPVPVAKIILVRFLIFPGNT